MPSISNFVSNAREIVVLAGVGTIISTLLVGFGLFYVKEVGKYFQSERESGAIAYMEKQCSYRHSDFLLVDSSLNLLYRVVAFKQAQTVHTKTIK